MSRWTRVLRIVRAALREIFDEASYDRFLQRNELSSSAEAYEKFWREREAVHARRPRCC